MKQGGGEAGSCRQVLTKEFELIPEYLYMNWSLV